MMHLAIAAAVLALGLTAPATAAMETKLVPADGVPASFFGTSLSIDGDNLIIGASHDDSHLGAVYTFSLDGGVWTARSKLLPDARTIDDFTTLFGIHVDLSGDTAVVSASRDSSVAIDASTVYVFRLDAGNWVQEAKIVNPAPQIGFGSSISVSGDVLVVSAGADGENGGAAFVYRRSGTTWVQEAKLIASDPQLDRSFARRVAVSGETIVVGRDGDHDVGVPWAAYVYRFDGADWIEEAKLVAPDGSAGLESMALADELLAVGSPGSDSLSGAVYLFGFDGANWIEQQRLSASDSVPILLFGGSVALDTGSLIIGALDNTQSGRLAGSAYVFQPAGGVWVEKAKLVASDRANGDRFGTAVSVSAGVAVVGAPEDDDNGSRSGSAYVYPVSDRDGDGVIDAIDNCVSESNSAQADADQSGIGDACNDDIDLDGDEWEDSLDNCPNTPNADQADFDSSGIGDVCNDSLDMDGDEWEDLVDNTPGIFNPGQEDRDHDGIGDLSDPFPDDPRLSQAVSIIFTIQEEQQARIADVLALIESLGASDAAQNEFIESLVSEVDGIKTRLDQVETRLSVLEAAVGKADCKDGVDNDGDGLIDFPADDGCDKSSDESELP